tara:strand:- start:565 stop:1254 length:690 start_codon:yes stop_codon:yes gene_type:complete
MSNKNLLNESQIRQFMKLASLEPLTPGFVNGLTERGSGPGDKGSKAAGRDLEEGTEEDIEESHGRSPDEGGGGPADQNSRGPGAMEENAMYREEDEADPHELEMDAADDLEDGSLEGDIEATDDELEVDAELGSEDEGRMVSVDDFLSALESALEGVLGDEVEIDSGEMADDEVEDEVEIDAELDMSPAGDEVDLDVEDELQEGTTDELVEQITRRVAARILKSALAKK